MLAMVLHTAQVIMLDPGVRRDGERGTGREREVMVIPCSKKLSACIIRSFVNSLLQRLF
jgi:3-polyprenyl-4-hydroxybenzoate decarboxylase